MSDILAAALGYRRRGFSVIPLGPNKKPAVRWKPYQASAADEKRIRRWFATPKPGVAVIFGSISGGLASRDFDDLATYDQWAHNYPTLAKTLPTVETRRGRHVYCIVEAECERAFRECIGKPQGTGAVSCNGGELRMGVGCYSVLPPSVHPEGHVYRWLNAWDSFPTIDLFNSGLGPVNREAQREPKTLEEGGEDDLPLPPSTPCLEYSLDSLLHEQVELAIQRTIPTRSGRRRRQLFEFCRELQVHPEFRGQSPKALKPLVREWHRRALPKIETKRFDDTWLDFVTQWPNVRYPKGEEPLAMTFAKVAATEPPAEAKQFDIPELQLLVSLCRELQIAEGNKPFFLACRSAGRLLQTSHVTVSRWLKLLCVEELLREVSKGSVATGQASRYRYLGEL